MDRVKKQKKDSVSLLNSMPNLVGDQKNVKLVNYAASFLEVLNTCHSPLSTIEREEVHTDKSGPAIQMPNCGVKHLNLDLIFKNLPGCIRAVYSSQLSLNPPSLFLFREHICSVVPAAVITPCASADRNTASLNKFASQPLLCKKVKNAAVFCAKVIKNYILMLCFNQRSPPCTSWM